MKDDFEYILDIYGYEKREYGWVRDNPKGTSQAVTLFDKDPQEDWITIQMFGWFTRSGDDPDYRIYNTGNIGIDTVQQFEVLIEIFDKYKHIDG